MQELPWFKVYTEAFHDPKFVVAATDNQMDEMTVFGIWMALLCLAARSPVRGRLIASNNRNYTLEQLEAIIGWNGNMGTGDISSLMHSFLDLDMVMVDDQGAYCIANFDERQETQEERAKRLHSERQKRYAEKQKSVNNDAVNDASLTHPSISTSTSNSLIKDSFNDDNRISTASAISEFHNSSNIQACVSLYREVTGQYDVPPALRNQTIQELQLVLDHYGGDIARASPEGKVVFRRWCNTKGKTGKSYAPNNPGWLSWWLAELAPKPEEMSAVERSQQEAERIREATKYQR